MGLELVPSLLGRCKQKQCWLRGLLCCWPSITEWRCTSLLRALVSEMTYTVSSWTLNSTIPYHTSFPGAKVPRNFRSRERKFPLRTFAPGSEKSWYQMRNVACGMIPYFTRCIYSAHSAIRDRLTRSIEPRMFVGSIMTDVRYGFTTFVCLVGIKHCYRLLSTGSSQLRKI